MYCFGPEPDSDVKDQQVEEDAEELLCTFFLDTSAVFISILADFCLLLLAFRATHQLSELHSEHFAKFALSPFEDFIKLTRIIAHD